MTSSLEKFTRKNLVHLQLLSIQSHLLYQLESFYRNNSSLFGTTDPKLVLSTHKEASKCWLIVEWKQLILAVSQNKCGYRKKNWFSASSSVPKTRVNFRRTTRFSSVTNKETCKPSQVADSTYSTPIEISSAFRSKSKLWMASWLSSMSRISPSQDFPKLLKTWWGSESV